MTPQELLRYQLTRAYLTTLSLSVDLELAREAGASTEQLANRLGIAPTTLLELEAALCRAE